MEDLKQQAYNNLADWIPLSDPPVAGFPMLLGNAAPESFTNPNLDLLGMEMSGARAPYHGEVEQGNCSYELGESSHCVQGFNPTFRNSFAMSDPLTHGFCMGDYISTDDLPVDDGFRVELPPWQGNGLFLDPGNHGIGIISSDSGLLIPRSGSPKTRWCKVLAVVKWRILVRRNVAARKCKRFYSYM